MKKNRWIKIDKIFCLNSVFMYFTIFFSFISGIKIYIVVNNLNYLIMNLPNYTNIFYLFGELFFCFALLFTAFMDFYIGFHFINKFKSGAKNER